ncbi:S8 family serine peptidase, partial [Nocardioides stalactiti]|uniref:S8 family serine peptidase n=1 Tax=Nocardioides stalactiti TaxID=2755356 RepID=UPI001603BF4F
MLRESLVVLLTAAGLAVAAPSYADEGSEPTLHLVTLRGPGTTGHRGDTPDALVAARMRTEQDAVLATVDAPTPVYRWTSALNGFAVSLSEEQHDALAADPRVALVEDNAVRPLADVAAAPATSATRPQRQRGNGGAGTVIGFVDTGIDPASPAFAVGPRLGPEPRSFVGTCTDAPEDPSWSAADCSAKIAAAASFVEGFGVDALRSAAVLSPRDTDGHGTQVASIAAGTADTPVRSGPHRLGRFSGVAPDARIAVYKACWSAPDPEDDGCATADLVAAIDRATAAGVDVLNLAVGGPSGTIDTVERALLGATEAGVVVTAAAGNDGADAYAAHPAPWVITVGAATSPLPTGAVLTRQGPRLTGAMA